MVLVWLNVASKVTDVFGLLDMCAAMGYADVGLVEDGRSKGASW